MSGYGVLLALHILAFAMGVGLSLSNFINTRLALAQGPEFAKGLALQRRTIARVGDGVIALIWLTGLVVLWWRGTDGLGTAFHLKMLFVVLLTVFHGLARGLGEKMRREGNMALLPRQSAFIAGVFVSALLALVLAVVAFRG